MWAESRAGGLVSSLAGLQAIYSRAINRRIGNGTQPRARACRWAAVGGRRPQRYMPTNMQLYQRCRQLEHLTIKNSLMAKRTSLTRPRSSGFAAFNLLAVGRRRRLLLLAPRCTRALQYSGGEARACVCTKNLDFDHHPNPELTLTLVLTSISSSSSSCGSGAASSASESSW